jgi:hypothetical protein
MQKHGQQLGEQNLQIVEQLKKQQNQTDFTPSPGTNNEKILKRSSAITCCDGMVNHSYLPPPPTVHSWEIFHCVLTTCSYM